MDCGRNNARSFGKPFGLEPSFKSPLAVRSRVIAGTRWLHSRATVAAPTLSVMAEFLATHGRQAPFRFSPTLFVDPNLDEFWDAFSTRSSTVMMLTA
jgi:hypothetical protein